MAEANGDIPIPLLVTVDDRLRRVEQALDRISRPGDGPPGFMSSAQVPVALPADDPAHGWGRLPPLRELRLVLGMYFDPRYRLSRPGQLGIPAVLALMLLDYLFFNWVIAIPLLPIVGVVCERVVLVGLAVVLYKLLGREAARYEAVLAYLTRHAR